MGLHSARGAGWSNLTMWLWVSSPSEIRMQEMVSMGVGNKPFLDIKPSEAAINDRAIDYIMKGRGECQPCPLAPCELGRTGAQGFFGMFSGRRQDQSINRSVSVRPFQPVQEDAGAALHWQHPCCIQPFLLLPPGAPQPPHVPGPGSAAGRPGPHPPL